MAMLFEGTRDQENFAEVHALVEWAADQGAATMKEAARLIAKRLHADGNWAPFQERRVEYILRTLNRMQEVRLELVDEAGTVRLPVGVVCAKSFDGACRTVMKEYRGFFRDLSLPVWWLQGGGQRAAVSDLRAAARSA